MPNFIVKAARDQDWYCRWSTIVDAPCAWGTREVMVAEARQPDEVAPERFDRADRNGTSAMIPGTPDAEQWFGWNDGPFVLMEEGPEDRGGDGCWLLPRANLREFCERLEADADTEDLCIWEAHE